MSTLSLPRPSSTRWTQPNWGSLFGMMTVRGNIHFLDGGRAENEASSV